VEVWVPLTCMGFLCESKEGLNVGPHNINNAKLQRDFQHGPWHIFKSERLVFQRCGSAKFVHDEGNMLERMFVGLDRDALPHLFVAPAPSAEPLPLPSAPPLPSNQPLPMLYFPPLLFSQPPPALFAQQLDNMEDWVQAGHGSREFEAVDMGSNIFLNHAGSKVVVHKFLGWPGGADVPGFQVNYLSNLVH
jgi:hypothetical protein